ncbi:NUDIX hydrolase [Nannocystis sp. SCPEA4]|uniref:NUDIX hydrolase n=1 Tax=Nannocystis sp. SCPEA4 TaxID=2996787 RepID=UPI00226DB507|nr:NUDIX hydrolase [Nannocystis sp. SCPEA4]
MTSSSPLKPFRYGESRELANTPIFRLHEIEAEHPRTGSRRQYVTLDAPDWVNLVALTPEGQLVLVRQWRHGTRRFELELPAGAIDRGETPEQAAARELLEETGYSAATISRLGEVAPNAAFQHNRCYTVLAEGCVRTGETDFDEGEDIEIVLCSPSELRAQLGGPVLNAMVFCGLYWWFERQGRVAWP